MSPSTWKPKSFSVSARTGKTTRWTWDLSIAKCGTDKQLLKRKSDYLLTLWVDTLGGWKTQPQPLPCSKQQIPTALQQVPRVTDLLYWRQPGGNAQLSQLCAYVCSSPTTKIPVKNEKRPSKIERTELRLLLKIMEIKEMKMKGNFVTGKHW